MVPGNDTTAILLATSNFCNEDCVSACSNDSSFSAVKQGNSYRNIYQYTVKFFFNFFVQPVTNCLLPHV